jgi:hypothetical protein
MHKIRYRISVLLTIATVLNGWLAGGDVYRYVIEVPAWRRLNILDWAEYSRYADLRNGIFLFPIEALGGFIPLLAASIMTYINKEIYRKISLSIYTATFFSLAGLILTAFAAPIMLSLWTSNTDPVAVQSIFDRFHLFGIWRTIVQAMAFFACIAAIHKIHTIRANR